MAFNSFSEFIAMGGHGLYVWASYAVAVGVILFNVFSLKKIKSNLLIEQKRMERRGSRT